MKILSSLVFAVAVGGLASAPVAHGAETKKEMTPQQQRMADCNKTAADKALKGEERKQFMSGCLGGKSEAAPAATSSQQDKMKTCNAEATKKDLKGDDRKQFMSGCLSK